MTRYVRDHDPFDPQQPHYADEPLVVRYASAAVDRLFAKYGRQLVIRAKSHTSGHVVIQPTAAVAGVTFTPLGPVEQEVFDAMNALTGQCLPGNWLSLFPYPLHTLHEEFFTNTRYTVSLQSRPQSEPGSLDFSAWAALLEADFELGGFVYRFDMRTSRFRNFAEHVARYAAAVVGDIFVEDPEELAEVVASLPAGSLSRSDEIVDALSAAAFGGPLIIPESPEVMRLWVPQGDDWRCVGLLFDGPEPLLRQRLQFEGGVEERILLELRSAAHPGVPFGSAQTLSKVQIAAGVRGARLFTFFEPSPGTAVPGAVLLRLQDRGQSIATLPATDHVIGVEVGQSPAVLTEAVS